MQPVPINYWAVVAAAVAMMFLGFIWYGPLFGKYWAKLQGFTQDKMNAAQQGGMAWRFILSFAGWLVMSYVLAHAIIFAGAYFKMTGLSAGLMSGVWNWLGFIAPVTLGIVLWEGKSWKLWFLSNGYYLLSLIAMGIILSVWR